MVKSCCWTGGNFLSVISRWRFTSFDKSLARPLQVHLEHLESRINLWKFAKSVAMISRFRVWSTWSCSSWCRRSTPGWKRNCYRAIPRLARNGEEKVPPGCLARWPGAVLLIWGKCLIPGTTAGSLHLLICWKHQKKGEGKSKLQPPK